MVLDVSALGVGRGGRLVLAGLSFRLGRGEALALRGPNGCGKTTLIRTLAGLMPPLAGHVSGAEPAYAGHLDGVKAQLTVAENLHFWAAVYGAAGIGRALARFGLEALKDRPARSLSAGQKRRLGLARLMLAGRALWLLDEPTVSLDAAGVADFARMVEAHLAAGGAAVIATHVAPGLDVRELDLTAFRAPAAACREAGADAFGGGW